MDLREVVTIVVSCLALVLSVTAFVVSTRLRTAEIHRSFKTLIHGIVLQIIETTDELQKASMEGGASAQQIHRTSSLRHRLSALARQGKYLLDDKPYLVGEVECATIAGAFALIGEYLPAEELWSRAVELSSSSYMESINRRGFADFLFSVGLVARGRREFERAIGCVDADTDFAKLARGYTYHMWMVSELLANADEEAEKRFSSARETLLAVENPFLRDPALRILHDERVQVRSSRRGL